MMHVVLDTNILHEEGMFSRNMQLLTRLASADQVTVHVPQLVTREYTSKIAAEASSSLQSMHTKLADILKKTSRANPIHDELVRTQAAIANIAKRLSGVIEEDFESWRIAAKAKVLHFSPTHIDAVFDHYFAGTGVFRHPKSRADLPDAFINSCIEVLLAETKHLDVVIKDGVFKRNLEKLEGVAVYDSVGDYLRLPQIVQRIAILDARSERTDSLKRFLAGSNFQQHLSAFLRTSDDLISDISVTASGIVGADALGVGPVTNQTIYFPESESLTDIKYGAAAQIGEGHFSIEIFFLADASIDYCIDRRAYRKISKEHRDEIDVLDNLEDEYELSEDRLFAFFGHAEVRFDPNFSAEDLRTHVQDLDSKHAKISIELEIEKAEIIPLSTKSD